MENDLQKLDISNSELVEITNLPVNNKLIIITAHLQKMLNKLVAKAKNTEITTIAFVGLSIMVVVYLFLKLISIFFPVHPLILLIIILFWVGGMTQTILYIFWMMRNKTLKENSSNSLRILLAEVEKYNAIIKAIDINDQIESVGNPTVAIQEREKVIMALKMTRDDLIRALKTERIIRENKNFIITNSELFVSNLASLAAMQVTEQATEHGRLLNEALQISLDVQNEMKQLH
ncbi:hypothetical protein H6F32_15365 [Anabaena sp. FACHB-1237]|uniref:hypothetical protein n=1 Tax=Anabaena sp. FACHB-1237 TaxID=2692769 RepID=UPI0016802766|nr:hypothetical protein [Anabaena sp. FACHB-1237]MBD2138920.1 hypothetical protein [Anabaena sp. FACHB-1237]